MRRGCSSRRFGERIAREFRRQRVEPRVFGRRAAISQTNGRERAAVVRIFRRAHRCGKIARRRRLVQGFEIHRNTVRGQVSQSASHRGTEERVGVRAPEQRRANRQRALRARRVVE